MIVSSLLLALTLPASAGLPCLEAQISEEHCERFQWAWRRNERLAEDLADLERRLKSLGRLRMASSADLAQAAADGGEIWAASRLVSGVIDDFGSPQLKGSLELRALVNEMHERLAGARNQVIALQRRGAAAIGGASFPAARWLTIPARPAAQGRPVAQGAASISRPKPNRIARVTRRGFRSSARLFEKEQRRALAILRDHERGRTETIGDPLGRAALLHRQRGQTCAVVAAQQLLLEHGRLPADQSSTIQEDLLFDEALASGYFRGSRQTGGTPWQFVGNLVQDRGLIVVKRVRASETELRSALESGKAVIADVDSAIFWHNRDYDKATHSIVVTGLEQDRATGRVLGFYVNDSDGGVYYAAGRLVPSETFLKAWRARAARFIEVK